MGRDICPERYYKRPSCRKEHWEHSLPFFSTKISFTAVLYLFDEAIIAANNNQNFMKTYAQSLSLHHYASDLVKP